ncbi:sugar phosphate permease [Litorimonas taeanensis]|uniref:Sugar phosphate permease n=1 Tax=Litorimonas taeanensis TaxID=568099 RepID=A0A420WLX2_9PROT|nr:MFS transporter [Litorimonas taeanensis]RKQ71980.1 sugar phosphate permease [Litorimonas taeanensis]
MNEAKIDYPKPTYAWSLVGFLTLAYIFSMMDRYILGYLIKDIKADLLFTDSQVGLLTGPAFTLLYALCAIPFGMMVDRKKRVWIIAFGIAVWSVSTMATGLMTTFVLFFLARMMVGVGEAVMSPAAFSIIGDSFPKERRAKPIATYSAALFIASTITSFMISIIFKVTDGAEKVMLPVFGELSSWQVVLLAVGAPGLLVALLFFFLKEPPRTESSQSDTAKLSDGARFAAKRSATLLCFVTIFTTMVAIAYAQFNWLPEMFSRTYGEEEWGRSAYAARNGAATFLFALPTYFIAGFVSDAWSKKGRTDAPFILAMVGLFIMVPATIIAPLMPTGWTAFGMLCIATVGVGMVSCVGVTALLQIVPGHVRGSIVAYYYLAITLLGGMVSPMLVGWLSTHVFGEDKLNLAMSAQPAIYGIPTILLLPVTYRLYRKELAAREGLENKL